MDPSESDRPEKDGIPVARVRSIPDVGPVQHQVQYVKYPAAPLRQGYKIGGNGALVLNALMSHAFGTNVVWPSQQRLCDLTGLGLRAVQVALSRLRQVGIITPGPRCGRLNTYRIVGVAPPRV
jgi:hypothetical protein